MASFVYVGEYSTACACKPRVLAAARSAQDDSQAATVAAAAGVELARRRAEQQRRQAQSAPTPLPQFSH